MSSLRHLIDSRISELSREMEQLFAETRERGRREFADQLNQAVRRMRHAADLAELGATLLDAVGALAAGAALLRVEDEVYGAVLKGERIRGVPAHTAEAFREFEAPLDCAAALASAVESRDPVVAANTASEMSAGLLKLLGLSGDARVSVFPLVARDGVPALVCAWGNAQASAIELLTQVAAGAWSELAPRAVPAPAPELVQIAPPPAVTPAIAPTVSAWDQLSAEEQQIHFRAQRFARVQVAELRLYEPEAVQAGRAHRDLYKALRAPIDAARDAFRKSFFARCASMVDYLHLELVRTLGNDDPELLGNDYPGPMA